MDWSCTANRQHTENLRVDLGWHRVAVVGVRQNTKVACINDNHSRKDGEIGHRSIARCSAAEDDGQVT